MAAPVQIAWTTPNGQAPDKNPYVLDSAQPRPNARTNTGCWDSNAYMIIMNVTARTPKTATANVSEHTSRRPATRTLGPQIGCRRRKAGALNYEPRAESATTKLEHSATVVCFPARYSRPEGRSRGRIQPNLRVTAAEKVRDIDGDVRVLRAALVPPSMERPRLRCALESPLRSGGIASWAVYGARKPGQQRRLNSERSMIGQ